MEGEHMSIANGLIRTGLAACAAAFLVTGCFSDKPGATKKATEVRNPKEESGAGGSKFVLGQSPLAFSLYGNYDWYEMQPWGGDPATRWIKESKKVSVTNIPSGGKAAQTFQAMLDSGQLPDVIFTERGTDVERLRKAGKLVPLDPYLDKYPNLKKWAGAGTLDLLRSEDGKLYQFPNWHTSTPTGNGGYSINMKLYEELGSPQLETFDDLYRYLQLVKQKYPNVVPFEVTIFGQGVDLLYSGFADDHPTLFISQLAVPQGDRLTSIFSDPVYKETMLYASKLYREKLMGANALSQTLEQVRHKVTSGAVAVMAAYNVTDLTRRGNLTQQEAASGVGYKLIWPLRKAGVDRHKVWPTQYDSTGWNSSVITTGAANPEGLYAYLDWLTGEEGQRVLNFGPESLYWSGTDEAGIPVLKPNYYDETGEINRLLGVWDTFQWAGNSTYMSKAWESVEKQRALHERGKEPQASIPLQTSFDATAFVNLDPAPESEEGKIAEIVRGIYDEAKAAMLNAKSDAEVVAALEQASKAANEAGYERLLQFKTAKWLDNKRKLDAKK
ncbi:extracellular solute-binding protein [Paenibacillus hemerocallicola]|uniref:Extracellular solute-binding protein n=2 Tax=Paenibacillus hemerocallicola TaxID=1172614 RepID=A0A5C4TB78_9BACL|nr:extracellular solute-binding protein [Paenibacillus hemerocallicola]